MTKNGIIEYVRTIYRSISAHGRSSSIEQLFPVEREYARCVTALNRTGILTLLPKSESIGVIGIDGKEYPIPTQEQVVELFAHHRELVGRKVPQGFDRLELTPMAMPTPILIDRMKAALLKHAAEGKMYQTRRSPSDPFIPVRVNPEKHVWIWDTLRQALVQPRRSCPGA